MAYPEVGDYPTEAATLKKAGVPANSSLSEVLDLLKDEVARYDDVLSLLYTRVEPFMVSEVQPRMPDPEKPIVNGSPLTIKISETVGWLRRSTDSLMEITNRIM